MIEPGNITKSVMKSSALAFAMTLSIASTGCGDSVSAPEPDAPAGKEMRICFSVKELPRTRVTHSGYSSTFDNGDEIGCIILCRDQNNSEQNFINSVWKYKDGVLILDSFITSYTKVVVKDWGPTNETIFGRQPQDQSELNKVLSRVDEDGYLSLSRNNVYEFYFYYPLIDNESLQSQFVKARVLAQTAGINFNDLISIPTSSNLSPTEDWLSQTLKDHCLVGRANDTYNPYWYNVTEGLTVFNWQEYPAFVNTTQWTKDQFNMSDYLCANYTLNNNGNPITQATEKREVSIEFKRINAVIEVQCEDEIPMGDIYFTSSSGLRRGSNLNLKTGDSSAEIPSSWRTDLSNALVASAETPFRPMPMDEDYTGTPSAESGSYHNYRIILPAQSFDNLSLHFTINGEEKTISLQNQLTEFEANHLYIIEIDKAGTSILKINDWQTGKYTVIEYTEP